jgi:hypothetical protein
VGHRRRRTVGDGHRPGAGDPQVCEARHRLDKIDLFEINEAFSAQYLAVEKELGLDRDRSTSTAARSRSGTRSARPARASR